MIDFEKKNQQLKFLLLVTGLLSSAILKKLSDDAYDVKEHSLSVDLRKHSR